MGSSFLPFLVFLAMSAFVFAETPEESSNSASSSEKLKRLRVKLLEIERMTKELSNTKSQATSRLNELMASKALLLEQSQETKPEIEQKESLPSDGRPTPLVKASQTTKRYYLGFNAGPALFGNQDYLAGIGDISIESGLGFKGEVYLKRYFDDFFLDLQFSFSHKSHRSIQASYLGNISCAGNTDVFSGTLGFGYQFNLNQRLGLLLSSKIGWAHADLTLSSPFFGNLDSNGFLLTGALDLEIRYRLSNASHIHLGYDFNLIEKDYPFSSFHFHSLQAGLGFHF